MLDEGFQGRAGRVAETFFTATREAFHGLEGASGGRKVTCLVADWLAHSDDGTPAACLGTALAGGEWKKVVPAVQTVSVRSKTIVWIGSSIMCPHQLAKLPVAHQHVWNSQRCAQQLAKAWGTMTEKLQEELLPAIVALYWAPTTHSNIRKALGRFATTPPSAPPERGMISPPDRSASPLMSASCLFQLAAHMRRGKPRSGDGLSPELRELRLGGRRFEGSRCDPASR